MADWRKAEDYAYTEGLLLREWAWEFLRRSPKYRRLWRDYVAFIKPDAGGQPVDDYGAPWLPTSMLRRLRGFQLAYPLNPDRDAIHFRDALERQWGGRGIRFLFANHRLPEFLYWNEGAIVFDMRLPIKPQLEMAGRVLASRIALIDERAYKPYKVSMPRKPAHLAGEWVKWLRALDAKAENPRMGAAKISPFLYPRTRANQTPSRSVNRAVANGRRYAAGGYKRLLGQVEVMRTMPERKRST